ncbi:hypothetical protein D1159_06465 [Pseudoflavonifractor sp. 524-17]|uniref:hypothetical protein n=1 Tax=Pseudoflavonifractor sp. 524-17 TaxID=2304577 RepID=UPI00137AEB41|nr:hypothetical protein [Pseudoflavonifractor sp. 524-17]NCE64235.1 hypothetical protein [Pseudoflavonifractor sp. 524-17]
MTETYPTAPGVHSELCRQTQYVFQNLSQYFSEIEAAPVTGLHTGPSVRNVYWFQRKLGCAQTGIVDRDLYQALTALQRMCQLNL